MGRGLRALLSPHEEVTFRRIALGISKAKHLPARDVTYLIHIHLVDENRGRLKLTDLGRERLLTTPAAADFLRPPSDSSSWRVAIFPRKRSVTAIAYMEQRPPRFAPSWPARMLDYWERI